ncbi:MAG TPA: MFS transporter [Planctomycetes bacterium]|nr:MFS transporter [Planctomycetota bacterium]
MSAHTTPEDHASPRDEGAPSLDAREARSLREISPVQWKSGIAAWLGWFFDGLDMHLYTLVAAIFVQDLLGAATDTEPEVKQASSIIQAGFLVGWALGGGFFGRIGDLLGRSRALCLTILTYAVFTGLSAAAQTWWQLLIFRFLAALGIGGEWAVGSALLAETWPRRWRPWIAAVLQSGVNIGILLACFTYFIYSSLSIDTPRYLFLVGILPALIVFWIRRAVPEPAEWQEAKSRARHREPGVGELFGRGVRRTTILTILLCGLSLTGWWAFIFWNLQHVRRLPSLAEWGDSEREQLVSVVFFLVILVSIFGNFFAGWLAKLLGYRKAIALCFAGMFVCHIGAYGVPRDHTTLIPWISGIGFFSGVFGLFTMYLPPLFPTLLRTTGAGFCYNIGRIVAAFGTVFFGLLSQVGDFRYALLLDGLLFVPAVIVACLMPKSGDSH